MSDTQNHTVKVTDEQRIFPEEDIEYEGTVDGKEWYARRTLGYSPMLTVMTEDNVELTTSERDAVREYLFDYL